MKVEVCENFFTVSEGLEIMRGQHLVSYPYF